VSVPDSIAAPSAGVMALVRVLLICLLSAAYLPLAGVGRASASGVDHLVVSEVMTGGTSASDELIELYNPSAVSLPLEGLELLYVTASGATVSRRAAWEAGSPEMPPGSHLLISNELGIFAPIADAVYASGMAATGGSVALRIQGASHAIDAVGWGTAASTWLEGLPAAAPPSGVSLERLPGGTAGSTVDIDDNVADFAVRALPDPQNSGSPPVPDPIGPSPSPTATATPTATPGPTGTPSPPPPPGPTPISIADARALPDDSVVTIEGDALTGSDFHDGGGYLADPSGGVAVLLESGSFARGDRVLVRGTIDDRFAQRTIRAGADNVSTIGIGDGPDPLVSATGSVNESVEARLVRIEGTIAGSPTTLTGGLAFEVDDGSGAARVVVATTSGIDTDGWANGARISVLGVVGQRDSTGTGAAGYRVQPRAAADVEILAAPTPSASESAGPEPTATPSPADGTVTTIATARAAAKNARVIVRGVVTLASGTVERGSAVIQDATGAILLRLGEDARAVSRGELVEVAGVRSTKSGMESLRVAASPRRLGNAPDPTARVLRTGAASEASEAQVVLVRGAVVKAARRAESGSVSFDIDDGSGPLRIVLGFGLKANKEPFASGTWVEVRGVLGQQTTGARPLLGYRVWPRTSDEVRILAGPTDASTRPGNANSAPGVADGGGSTVAASLSAVGEAGLADLRVGATLVVSNWPELGVAGLLWDGVQLVGIAPSSAARVDQILEQGAMPLSLELLGLRELHATPPAGITLVTLGQGRGDTVVGSAPPAHPSPTMPDSGDPAVWVSLVGRVTIEDAPPTIEVDGSPVAVEWLCRRDGRLPEGTASLVGVGLADPPRIVVGCDGIRRAPGLALMTTVLAGTEPAALAPGASVDADAAPMAGRRLLAAVLLMSGVAILIVAVVAARRFAAHGPDVATPDEAAVEEPVPAATQLTLIRLPNEHGP